MLEWPAGGLLVNVIELLLAVGSVDWRHDLGGIVVLLHAEILVLVVGVAGVGVIVIVLDVVGEGVDQLVVVDSVGEGDVMIGGRPVVVAGAGGRSEVVLVVGDRDGELADSVDGFGLVHLGDIAGMAGLAIKRIGKGVGIDVFCVRGEQSGLAELQFALKGLEQLFSWILNVAESGRNANNLKDNFLICVKY